MEDGMVGRDFSNRIDVHPSGHDRCAECGEAVGDEWVSYRQDSADSETLTQHFGGIIRTGPVEPRSARPKRRVRDFRCPEDLGVFFHPATPAARSRPSAPPRSTSTASTS